ncbi:peptidylprolyl isomerase [Sediminitomix flava]|uniref:Periplasmic chaperone PpiD n=1 Tax=Sediminitomix flava TaxID=379075 RepID=A0A315Z0E5_SEDFL|nr:peptidylprolyl isomerase [Sediminitomix flava]PWJ36137.1 peptidyl-prolyl cis-trans isomerase D [Sediminitomix flava]
MAIISKIREKSGLAVGAIAIGLIGFVVGGDLLSGNSRLLGSNKQIVGEINGMEIDRQEFETELERQRALYSNQLGQYPAAREMQILRDRAWNAFIEKYAYDAEYDKLGLKVTPEELEDMIKGNNIHPYLKQSPIFLDSLGNFSKERVIQYLGALKQQGANSPAYVEFMNFEQQLPGLRVRQKYENLLSTSNYATDLEGKKEYEKQNTKADVAYLYVPFYSVADSLVEVSNGELKDYYNSHKEDFKRDETRSIQFVSFSIAPSADDKAALEREVNGLKQPFAEAVDDSVFVQSNTEAAAPFMSVNATGVPSTLDINKLEKGEVAGPFFAANAYRLYKVMDVEKDTVLSARASHILIKAGDDKAAAKKEAQGILNEIKGGADFAQMARKHGQDGTKAKGGDLNWFSEGAMVKPFNDAVFKAKKTGLLPRLVETEFGYHIIDVTETATDKKVVLGVVERPLNPSERTINEAFTKAGRFAASSKDKGDFEENAKADSLFIQQAIDLRADARNINNIYGDEVRPLIRWAFDEDTNNGDVSDEFQLNDNYVVVNLIGSKDEGYESFESVKDQVKREVLKAKKGEYIAKKLKETSADNLGAMAAAYGKGAKTGSAADLAFGASSISGIGFAPKTIGTVFTMKAGDESAPIIDDNGVVVVNVENITNALETADYSIYKGQINQRQNNSTTYKIGRAITDLSEVKDNRAKFY